jgi:multidrug efflux pump subunit AcrA (membrane-fusion protein)
MHTSNTTATPKCRSPPIGPDADVGCIAFIARTRIGDSAGDPGNEASIRSVGASGKVREVAPQVDAMTRSRRVKIALESPPYDFRLGTTVTAYATAQGPGT